MKTEAVKISNPTVPVQKQGLLGRCTAVSVYIFQNIMPDPFVFAVLLTFVGALLAWWLAPNGSPMAIASAWYGGVFAIFTFAFQMVIMLVAGYALATAPQVHRALVRLASLASTPARAISLTIFVALVASWLNWGLGLVTAALLAREIAKRVRIDFGWLVAAAYSGFVISTEGLSGSIALSQATHGSALNIVEKITGLSSDTSVRPKLPRSMPTPKGCAQKISRDQFVKSPTRSDRSLTTPGY